jgi:hypothetical protein
MYYSDPPYFLIFAGLFIAFTCGYSFYITLTRSMKEWSKSRSSRLLMSLQGEQLFVPFLGISVGSCLFLASCLEIFGIPPQFSYGLSLPLTIFVNGLVWRQLGQVLKQLEMGGSKALDLDALSLGTINLPSQVYDEADK